METKEVRRIRLIGRICELVERCDGASFNVGGDKIRIRRVFYKNVYNHEGTEIFINEERVTWDDFEFDVLEEIVDIIHECNLGITY